MNKYFIVPNYVSVGTRANHLFWSKFPLFKYNCFIIWADETVLEVEIQFPIQI